MGACCSGGAPAKEPEDLTLDELEVDDVGVEDVDGVFGSAADPLNIVVGFNNGIITSIEKVKVAAAMLAGASIVKITKAEAIAFDIFSVDDNGNESKAGDSDLDALYKAANGAVLKTSVEAATRALTAMNTAVSECPGASVSIKKGRIFAAFGESKEEDKPKVKATKTAVVNFNNRMFKVKLELIKASAASALDPKVAFREVVESVKGALKDMFRPNVVLDLGGLAEGNVQFDVNFGDFAVDVLPARIRNAYEAIMGDDPDDLGLVPTVKDVVSQLSGVMDALNAAKEAVEGLPQGQEFLDKCKEAGLSPGQLLSAPGKLAGNVKMVSTAPAVLQGLLTTISTTASDLKEAIEAQA
eukprot:CAMPEP_0198421274 /NCGR_PEP_ID=MMETSP1452-20131203/1476_1 /TAXON_ID=1181717 /ORGANISM="Synchroma pusillum, Strain CCMP3072" /LENGTH=355 /DNA_ID=CAMNT_0044141471 /DNA_START=69 /DNA_END=1136 /DNA_ORIENTATION=-